jgi:hypothetical protein
MAILHAQFRGAGMSRKKRIIGDLSLVAKVDLAFARWRHVTDGGQLDPQ